MESFLVRVWHPAAEPADEDRDLRGTVVHLPSRQRTTFKDGETLLAILDGTLIPPPDDAGPPPNDTPDVA